MTFAWCILADIGVFILCFKQLRWRNVIHGISFALAAALTAYTVSVMLSKFNPSQRHLGPKARLHYCTGVTVLGWVITQAVVGIIIFVMFWVRVAPRLMLILRLAHKWSGYVLVVLCKLQIMLGWWMFEKPLVIMLVAADILLFISGILYVSRLESQPLNITRQQELAPPNEITEAIMQTILSPYNSVVVKQLPPYIVFNDFVFLLIDGFHPGGQTLIDKVINREVDRYLYGMYPIEDFIDSPQHTHSSASIKALGAPIGRVPNNKLYSMQDIQLAQLHSFDRLNDRLTIFYLNANAVYQDQFNLRHIGQYFRIKLNGNPLVRLYTTVSCMSIPNRRLVNVLLRKLQKTAPSTAMLEDPNNLSPNLIPLVIRCYPEKEGFTKFLYDSMLFSPQNERPLIEISKLLGRGLCLDKLK